MKSDEQDILQQIERSIPPLPTGVAGLALSIHRDPTLRDWVTLESILLPPVPYWHDGHAFLVGLITRPAMLSDGSPGYAAPWGAIEWSMPEGEVVRTLDLSVDKETDALQAFGSLLQAPIDPAVTEDANAQRWRELKLWGTLDNLFSTRVEATPVQLHDLASQYAGLLPGFVYLYYWKIAPGSSSWLRPNIPAIQIPSSNEKTSTISNIADLENQTEEARMETSINLDLTDRPNDVTEHLDGWISTANEVAVSLHSETSVRMLSDLKAHKEMPVFRLAFVGEFSRGKSTLLNRLFQRELLPVGAVPVTAHPTIVMAADDECLEVLFPDGRIEKRPIDAWDNLVALPGSSASETKEAMIRLKVNERWLKDLEAEFVDTPGVNDISERRAALVLDTLSRSDGAVVVLSALQPISMTEATFVQHQVLGQHVSHLLVVVSRLDQIELSKRAELMDYIQKRVDQIATGIPVLPLEPLSEDEQETDAIDRVRVMIGAIAAKNERRAWRSHQIAWRVADYVRELQCLAHDHIMALRLSTEERTKKIAEAKLQARKGEMIWDSIRLELEGRRLNHERSFRKRLETSKQDMLESLQYDLSRSPDPKTWWERDLPFRLRRELVAAARRSEQSLTQLIASDYEWMRAAVKKDLSADISGGGQIINPIDAGEIPLETKELADVTKYRLLSRIGLGLGAAAGMLLLGPLGIAATAGIGALSEMEISRRVEEQKQALMLDVYRAVDSVIDEACRGFGHQLREMYEILIRDVHSMQTKWLTLHVDAMEKTPESVDINICRNAEQKVEQLYHEIITHVQSPN